jgi:hypothetical protein
LNIPLEAGAHTSYKTLNCKNVAVGASVTRTLERHKIDVERFMG